MTQPRTRQELYDRIRQTSRESFILEDMIRLGFWPKQGEIPQDPADEIRRRTAITQELTQLRAENRRLHNEEALIQEARRKRLEESRQKRLETKQRHERERQERATAWQARKKREVVFLGDNVSGGLHQATSDETRLAQHNLPLFQTPIDLALAMNIPLDRLRFLAFSRQVSRISHYVRFLIPKKTGGERLISAPMPHLKEAQNWILNALLNRVALHDCAHGFRDGRSIVTNAMQHVGAHIIVNADLKDFFPTITFRRVKGAFQALGYSEAVSTPLALLCTEPDIEEVEMDGTIYYVSVGERRLPQGAPTSPALSNIVCRRLDRRLQAAAEKFGFCYTRYADDLTFSANSNAQKNLGALFRTLHSIVKHEGFEVRTDKTRVLHASQRQEVTGIVVNRKPSISRENLRRFRALLFQIEKDGPTGKRWGDSLDIFATIHGYANFVAMVSPEKGDELRRRVKAILDRYGWKPPRTQSRATLKPLSESTQPVQSEPPSQNEESSNVDISKQWWKLW